MRINRSNTLVQEFQDIGILQELVELNVLYHRLSPDINSLRDMLLPVVSEIVLCPDNGAWRCAAITGAREKQIAIFFPFIFSKNAASAAKPSNSLAIGTSGDVEPDEINQFYQKVVAALK